VVVSLPRHQPEQRPDVHKAWSDLAQPPVAPDLSSAIMGRLGYQRVSPQIARRRRLVARANRAGILMIAAIAFAIGWRVFEASPQIRRPAETTISDAINHDVQWQQQRLERAIRSIRTIATPRLQIDSEGAEANPSDDDRPRFQREFEDDVNRSTIAPVRWV
jgi:hypothetical protein